MGDASDAEFVKNEYLQFITIEEIRLLAIYNNKIGALRIDFTNKKDKHKLPRETFATTAAIPMIIPRVVRPERSFALHMLPEGFG